MYYLRVLHDIFLEIWNFFSPRTSQLLVEITELVN